MLNKIAHFIDRHHLLRGDGRYLVALSGGADSVALLLVLRELGYALEAVHCNFRLRGDESERDEQFCVNLCQQHHVTLHRVHFDTRIYASAHRMSIETAARELRYHYFEQLRNDIGADGICVAHHRDDQAETVLMNIIRGTGLHGLTGMAPINGYVIRPFLCVSRVEIEEWLHQRQQGYVTDSTNLLADATRNRIRLNILPLLNDLNTCATENICRLSERMVEVEKVVSSAVSPMTDMVIDTLLKESSPYYTLYVSLKPFGFNTTQIEEVFSSLGGVSGKQWYSATHQLLIDRERIIVEPLQPERRQLRLPETGKYIYDDHTSFRVETVDRTADFVIPKTSGVAVLDADDVCFPLLVRPVHEGDRFVPLGMHGSKLLSDYMTDRKMTLFEKQRQLVVQDAKNRIVWVVNERPSNLFRITSQTSKVLRIEFLQG